MLLLDSGAFFTDRLLNKNGSIIAGITMKAMDAMGYAAMNASAREFAFGVNFLRERASGLSSPLVASNLSYAEGTSPFTKRYVMVGAGDLKVAILGIMPYGLREKIKRSMASDGVEVTPPAEALASILPEIRGEADVVILLSRLGQAETQQFVDTVEGIDLALFGGKDNAPDECGEENETRVTADGPRTPIFGVSAKGTRLGYVRLSVDDSGRVAVAEERTIPINGSVPADEKILAITGENVFQRIADERRRAEEELQREIERLHKLTPMEYMQKLLREQEGAGKQ